MRTSRGMGIINPKKLPNAKPTTFPFFYQGSKTFLGQNGF